MPSETVRLNLDLSEATKSMMVALKDRTDAASLTEVVRRSISLYDAITAHSADGGKVIFEDCSGQKTTLKIL